MAVVLPDGVDAVLDLIGVGWPNVDEDAYRDMAVDLREFAEDVDDDAHTAHQGVQRLLSSGESEALTALSGYWDKVKGKHLTDLAGAARIFADAMDAAADIIEARKWVAVGELTACAASAGISLAAAPFTAGLSALIGAGAIQACRIAVKRAIKEMLDMAVEAIVTAMTEPAVKSLENMAAELVVQLAANGLGVQDGVDMGEVGDAGKKGFQEGVQSGKEGLHLASADSGPSMGGMIGKLDIDHGEHDNAVLKLNGVSTSLNGRTTSKLNKARASHGRTRGKDEIADAIDTVADSLMASISKSTKHLGDHMGGGLPKGIQNISTAHKGSDGRARDGFNAISRGDGAGKGTSGYDGPGGDGGRRGGGPRYKPRSMRDVLSTVREKAVALPWRRCETDPVDVASGEMVLAQTDVALPGVLPLILRRTHISSYRYGHCFGASWASTLDERLELAAGGPGTTVLAREDGSLLVYPGLPQQPGDRAWPLEGARCPLELVEQSPLGEVTYSVTDPHSGLTRQFVGSPYSSGNLYWLRTIQDRNGNAVEIQRREDGLPTTVLHDGGYRVTVTSDPSLGRVTSLAVHTPDGAQSIATFGYDTDRNLTTVSNCDGAPLRFGYDTEGRITSWTDRTGSTYSYVYDQAGRVTETHGPDGYLSSHFAYDTEQRATRYTDSTGAVTVAYLNAMGQVVAETDPSGNTVLRQWDRYDNLLSRTDALGNTARFEWDEHGNLTATRFPDGSVSTAEYDAMNLPVKLTGPDGTTWTQTWDDRGNRISVTGPDGSTSHFRYDAAGALRERTDPTGKVERLTNDATGLPLTISDATGNQWTVRRDAFGRPVEGIDPHGTVTRMEWTPQGWLSRRVSPGSAVESWTWDREGRCTSHTDALGEVTRFEYTHFDRLAARTGADGARYEFTYDTELRLTQVRSPQHLTWTYTYDAVGNLVSETDFDDRTVTYTHDATGHVTLRTTPMGDHISTTYDAMGRVITKNAAGQLTHYAYDAAGRIKEMASQASTLRLQRDQAGRLLAETVDGHTTAYTYDAAGRVLTRTTPSGVLTDISYDTAGNRTRLVTGGHHLAFTHDELGRELTRTFGTTDTPLTLSSAWNDTGRLASQTLATTSSTLRSRAYTYRPDGCLGSVTDHLTGRTKRLQLDPVGRPVRVTAENWTETYAYDLAGNQTQGEWPNRARHNDGRGERTYAGTRLLTAGSVHCEYDAAGRTLIRRKKRLSRTPDTWRYSWDAENRLTSCVTPDGTQWKYAYDPLGRRTAKHRMADDGLTVLHSVHFTWDGTRLAEQTDTAGGTTLTWEYEGYRPLAQLERRPNPNTAQPEIDSRFFAIVTDLVGSPSELVGEDGHIAWHTRTTAWGATTWNRDATAYTPLRFPGQYDDPETGLHYNYFRHYDPETARYASPDPLGLQPSPNPVAYVTNPFTRMDPEGLIAKGCTEDGGWYSGLKPANLKDASGNRRTSQDMEINHIPPKDAYLHLGEPGFTNNAGMGPAIRMEYDDHRALMSTGSSHASDAWRAVQRQLIDSGQWDQAMKMDIGDIRQRFDTKYDGHIADMVDSLKNNKKFQAMLDSRGWTINYDLLK